MLFRLRTAALHAIAHLLRPFYWLYCKTVRLTVIHEELSPERLESKTNAIYVFWHAKTFLLLPLYQNPKIGALTLLDWKNVIYDKLCRLYHYHTVPVINFQTAGVELKTLLDNGFHIALAPDGPKGPAGTFKRGALHLSRTTGKPLIALNVRYEKSFRIRSRWDNYEVPLPFTRATLSYGTPMQVDDENIDEVEKKVIAHLHDL